VNLNFNFNFKLFFTKLVAQHRCPHTPPPPSIKAPDTYIWGEKEGFSGVGGGLFSKMSFLHILCNGPQGV
jgi:hypothetical protein